MFKILFSNKNVPCLRKISFLKKSPREEKCSFLKKNVSRQKSHMQPSKEPHLAREP